MVFFGHQHWPFYGLCFAFTWPVVKAIKISLTSFQLIAVREAAKIRKPPNATPTSSKLRVVLSGFSAMKVSLPIEIKVVIFLL